MVFCVTLSVTSFWSYFGPVFFTMFLHFMCLCTALSTPHHSISVRLTSGLWHCHCNTCCRHAAKLGIIVQLHHSKVPIYLFAHRRSLITHMHPFIAVVKAQEASAVFSWTAGVTTQYCAICAETGGEKSKSEAWSDGRWLQRGQIKADHMILILYLFTSFSYSLFIFFTSALIQNFLLLLF